jgi:EAL domain-containing protein (putative c-di-GMP-specific phosphodiesterase class I)
MEEMLSVGAQLHAAGIRIAIDDVGSDVTDYDLVEQLLPHLDIMKFALQNMRALGQMDNVEAVIAKWRDLAARYHVEFTFEGVETPEDLQLAGRSGVSEVQGYYFNKPALPATFCKE